MDKLYDIEKALLPLLKVFSALNIPYYICGSVASSAYGLARTTQDVDVVSAMNSSSSFMFCELLKADYFLDLDAVIEAIEKRQSFNLIHLKSMIKIDVFVMRGDEYHISTFERIRKDSLSEHDTSEKINFSSPEDTILSKLQWFRESGETSEKQWLDITGVLKVQNKLLDFELLRTWASRLGLEGLLKKAIEDSGIAS